jgi:hypothetical protein
MTWLSRGALVAALLAAGCGGNGSSGTNKPTGIGGGNDDGGTPAPGQEAGTPGTRGGGGGPFGGNETDGGGAVSPDTSVGPADGPTPGLDAGRDLPADRSFTPIDAVSMADSAPPAPDMGGPDPCNNPTCEMLESSFRDALIRARMCNPTLKSQCLMTSASGLRCAGCKVWVNSNVELNGIRAMWNSAGCQTCPRMCPAVACGTITKGTCYSRTLPYQEEEDQAHIIAPPPANGTCIDETDPVPF